MSSEIMSRLYRGIVVAGHSRGFFDIHAHNIISMNVLDIYISKRESARRYASVDAILSWNDPCE